VQILNLKKNPWISATFAQPVKVNCIKVAALKGVSGNEYLSGSKLQYYSDDRQWIDVLEINCLAFELKVLVLDPKTPAAQNWRIIRLRNSFLSVSSLVFE